MTSMTVNEPVNTLQDAYLDFLKAIAKLGKEIHQHLENPDIHPSNELGLPIFVTPETLYSIYGDEEDFVKTMALAGEMLTGTIKQALDIEDDEESDEEHF